MPYGEFIAEIKKLQLLCKPCHIVKTRGDLGQLNSKETHGTLSSYKYCKCDLCKEAHRKWHYEYLKEYRKTHPRKK